MTSPAQRLQPVVFLGPTCPAADIRAILPDAFIVPPVARGDLYRYRLLGFSVFLILDGVFGNALAVSPREVVDVIEDGGAVIGASSMGALRAADCLPAGAIGHGLVYRLYRSRVLGSEDEVAVTYMAQRPWPALTQALVNMRFAIRRAARAGLLGRKEARVLEHAAFELPFAERSWDAVADRAGVALSQPARDMLAACDVKRDDALACCRQLAELLERGGIDARPRRDASRPVGRMLEQRERGIDVFAGARPESLRKPYLAWLSVCGAAGSSMAHADPDWQDTGTQALLMRFAAFRKARKMAAEAAIRPGPLDLARAGEEIARVHGHAGWRELLRSCRGDPGKQRRLHRYRRDRASISVLLRGLGNPVDAPTAMQ